MELLKFYAIAILLVPPIYILAVKAIFKKSYLTKIGIVVILIVVATTIITVTIEHFNLPRIIGLPLRLIAIIIGLLSFRDIKILNEAKDILYEISKSNLKVKVPGKYLTRKDEFGEIFISIYKMSEQLKKLIKEIDAAVKVLYETSEEIREIATTVANEASNLAVSSEEIASSMEETLEILENSSQKAEEIKRIVIEGSNRIEDNNDKLLNSVEILNKILEKISIIDEFSNKTEILSINVSIEAARTEEKGGFSVIANEIRKLAQHSRKEAESLNKLIREGNASSEEVLAHLNEINHFIKKGADYINYIVNSTSEQKAGIDTVNDALLQLSKSSAEYSASAEQMQYNVTQMNAQAELLQKIISGFIV